MGIVGFVNANGDRDESYLVWRLGRRLTWEECVDYSRRIWGDYAWRHELTAQCGVTARTLSRWKNQGYIPKTVTMMLNAFLRLRHYGMTLPEKEGCAP
jgi:hypothetical protein